MRIASLDKLIIEETVLLFRDVSLGKDDFLKSQGATNVSGMVTFDAESIPREGEKLLPSKGLEETVMFDGREAGIATSISIEPDGWTTGTVVFTDSDLGLLKEKAKKVVYHKIIKEQRYSSLWFGSLFLAGDKP